MTKQKKDKPVKPTEKSFVVDGKYLYEMVGDVESRVLSYVRYDKFSGEYQLADKVVKDGITYIPPQNELPFTGTLLLPTYPEEYDSFSELLESVRGFIDMYLELPLDYLMIASYYVLLSWVFDGFEAIPYLRARGEYGTGKSRFLRVVGSLCYRPCFAGGASTVSPIFRLIDLYGGITLILDEADFRFSGPDAEIIKILNTGYMKGCPVLRTEGDRVRVPTAYNTYGPKLIATRKEFMDLALESRCLTNHMTPMTRTDIPLHLPRGFSQMARNISNQLLMFRLKNYGSYEIDESFAIKGVEPRINQVLLPMFAIVKDEKSRAELHEFAMQHAKTQVKSRGDTIEADVLQAIVDLKSDDSPYVYIKDIATRMNADRDKDQGQYKVSTHKIGKINKTSFGFETRRIKGVTQIMWDMQFGEKLCKRYGVNQEESPTAEEVEMVEHVEDLFGAKITTPGKQLSDKEVNHEQEKKSTKST